MLEHPKAEKSATADTFALTAASAVMMVLSLVGMIFLCRPFVGLGAGVEQRLGDDESGKQQRRQLVLPLTVGRENYYTSSRFTLGGPAAAAAGGRPSV